MTPSGAPYDAQPFVPAHAGVDELRRAAGGCRGCPLYRDATQTVFGSGPPSARLLLLGEQPGDVEDREGEPFVGPAGRVLAEALGAAGIDRQDAYVTNAVKHFKFEPRGKRRIHKPPTLREISACRPWLAAEVGAVGPEVVIALGASAGKAVFGSGFRVTRQRGALLPLPALDATGTGPPEAAAGALFLATNHPSAVLRAEDRAAALGGLVADLGAAAEALAKAARTDPGATRPGGRETGRPR